MAPILFVFTELVSLYAILISIRVASDGAESTSISRQVGNNMYFEFGLLSLQMYGLVWAGMGWFGCYGILVGRGQAEGQAINIDSPIGNVCINVLGTRSQAHTLSLSNQYV